MYNRGVFPFGCVVERKFECLTILRTAQHGAHGIGTQTTMKKRPTNEWKAEPHVAVSAGRVKKMSSDHKATGRLYFHRSKSKHRKLEYEAKREIIERISYTRAFWKDME